MIWDFLARWICPWASLRWGDWLWCVLDPMEETRMNLNLPTITMSTFLAVLGYLGGVAGAIIGAYNVGNWHQFEQSLIITAIGEPW